MEEMKAGCFFRIERVCEPPGTPQPGCGRIDATRTVTVGDTVEKREVVYTTRFTSK